MTSVITSAICASQYAILENAIDDWTNDTTKDFDVAHNGATVKAFSRKLEDAVELFLNSTADAGKKVADDAKQSIIEIDRLCFAYESFKILASEESPLAPPYGSDDFWSAWRNVVDYFSTKPHYPRPQSIETLLSQKVGQMQIATIYGWTTANGAPDVEKVTEEIAEPGKHYKPDSWVHPAKAVRQRTIESEWKKRTSVREAKFDVRNDSERFGKFVPPSLSEMVALGAPAAQIANVHKISAQEAEQLLIEAGTEPKREIVPANAQVARLERLMKESLSNSAPHSLVGKSGVQSDSNLLQQV